MQEPTAEHDGAEPLIEPVVAGVPPLAADDNGVQWLTNVDSLLIREVFSDEKGAETCETRSRFMVAAFPKGVYLPSRPNTLYLKPLCVLSDDVPMLQGKRETESLAQRCVLPLFRSFRMSFALPQPASKGGDDEKQQAAPAFFRLERPLVVEPCPCWPCCYTQEQAIVLKDRDGHIVARAREPLAACGRGCCVRTFSAEDADGERLYTLRAPRCATRLGSNMCAPGCCNNSFDVDVYNAGSGAIASGGALLPSEYLLSSTFVYPGFNCAGLSERSDLVLRFPAGAGATERASLLAAMVLVDATEMELQRLGTNHAAAGRAYVPQPAKMRRK